MTKLLTPMLILVQISCKRFNVIEIDDISRFEKLFCLKYNNVSISCKRSNFVNLVYDEIS